jgi:hypothetical protein
VQGVSSLTGLTRLVATRVPGVCALVDTLAPLWQLRQMHLHGAEGDADAMWELPVYLRVFACLDRLDLHVQPRGAARGALMLSPEGGAGAVGRGAQSSGATSDGCAVWGSDDDSEGCSNELSDPGGGLCGRPRPAAFGRTQAMEHMRLRFWSRLREALCALPLEDGVVVFVEGLEEPDD